MVHRDLFFFVKKSIIDCNSNQTKLCSIKLLDRKREKNLSFAPFFFSDNSFSVLPLSLLLTFLSFFSFSASYSYNFLIISLSYFIIFMK